MYISYIELPIEIVKNILSYDNYIIRGNEVIQINKIKKTDERYNILYYTFSGNSNNIILYKYGYGYKCIDLLKKGKRLYSITYINDEYCIFLTKHNNNEPPLFQTILYTRN